jgi:hypothetical protein
MAIAAAVGVLVIGGGTAAAVLLKGGGTQSPPSVTQDTVNAPAAGNTSGQPTGNPVQPAGNTSTRTNPRTQTTTTAPRDTAAAPVVPPPERGIPVSAGDAFDRLDALMSRFDVTGHTAAGIASAAKDTALAYYNNGGVAKKDRAYAAYILSNAEGALANTSEALRWARIAVDLDPGSRAYQANLTGLQRPPE